MEEEISECEWFLLRIGANEFAIQYEGPNPDTVFPATLQGMLSFRLKNTKHAADELVAIVAKFYTPLQHWLTFGVHIPTQLTNDILTPPISPQIKNVFMYSHIG